MTKNRLAVFTSFGKSRFANVSAGQKKKRNLSFVSSFYLIVGRCGFNRPGDDQTDLGTRLTQNGRHLLRAHASQADFSDLKNVVATLQSSILRGTKRQLIKVNFFFSFFLKICAEIQNGGEAFK